MRQKQRCEKRLGTGVYFLFTLSGTLGPRREDPEPACCQMGGHAEQRMRPPDALLHQPAATGLAADHWDKPSCLRPEGMPTNPQDHGG